MMMRRKVGFGLVGHGGAGPCSGFGSGAIAGAREGKGAACPGGRANVGHLAGRGRCGGDRDRRRRVRAIGETGYRPMRRRARVLRAALGTLARRPAVAEAAARGRGRPSRGARSGSDRSICRAFTARRWPMTRTGQRTHQAGDGARVARGAWGSRWSGISAAPTCSWAGRARRWRRSTTGPGALGGLRAPVAFLNLGGVGNITWVDPPAPPPMPPARSWPSTPGPPMRRWTI
jgi:hypothetical protein